MIEVIYSMCCSGVPLSIPDDKRGRSVQAIEFSPSSHFENECHQLWPSSFHCHRKPEPKRSTQWPDWSRQRHIHRNQSTRRQLLPNRQANTTLSKHSTFLVPSAGENSLWQGRGHTFIAIFSRTILTHPNGLIFACTKKCVAFLGFLLTPLEQECTLHFCRCLQASGKNDMCWFFFFLPSVIKVFLKAVHSVWFWK